METTAPQVCIVITPYNSYSLPLGTLAVAYKDGPWNAYFLKTEEGPWTSAYLPADRIEILGEL